MLPRVPPQDAMIAVLNDSNKCNGQDAQKLLCAVENPSLLSFCMYVLMKGKIIWNFYSSVITCFTEKVINIYYSCCVPVSTDKREKSVFVLAG